MPGSATVGPEGTSACRTDAVVRGPGGRARPVTGAGPVPGRDVTLPARQRPDEPRAGGAGSGRTRRCEWGPSGGVTSRGEGITTMVEGARPAVSGAGLRHDGKLVRVAVPAYGTIRCPGRGAGGAGGDRPESCAGPGARQDPAGFRQPRSAGPAGSVHGTRPLTSAGETAEGTPGGRADSVVVPDRGTGR